MSRKRQKFDPSREAESPDSVSSLVSALLIEKNASDIEKDERDDLSGMKAVAAHAAKTYMAVFAAAGQEFARRGWSEEDSYHPAHQIAAQLLARVMGG